MKALFSAKPLLAAAVAFGVLAAASAAHARSDVVFSIGLNAPYGYVQPAPVYVQPQPVYFEPQPVYYQQQPIYYQQQPIYYQQQPAYVYGRDHRHYHGHRGHRFGPWADADGDGVPNRYDRAPNNPYRR